jgi:hypothetical protein
MAETNHSGQDPCETPAAAQGSSVTRAISDFLSMTNDEEEPNAKWGRYLKFTPEQLSRLITACTTPARPLSSTDQASPTSVIAASNMAPAYMTNAEYEEIRCKPIKPIY